MISQAFRSFKNDFRTILEYYTKTPHGVNHEVFENAVM
ncbi:hypothetical protein SaSA20_0216 [Streptococcus agalactiae]|nr:hypothetical protein SaSA20_0216 [Streptococcus agalactiae]